MEGDVETAPCPADDPLSAEGNMMEMMDGDEQGCQILSRHPLFWAFKAEIWARLSAIPRCHENSVPVSFKKF